MSLPIIHFTNPGEIDLRLITTMGVNVKTEGSNPIGYFGTGLKYAIATCIRLGCQVQIFSGARRLSFEKEEFEVRGKSFEQIIMLEGGGHKRELGFTTELGKNWQMWMAFRELYSNALDEGGDCGLGPRPAAAGTTTILITGEPMAEAFRNKDDWFLATNTTLFPSVHCEISRRPTNYAYYKRVRVTQLPISALFTYNLQGQHNLTEDRTLGYYEFQKPIATALGTECQDAELLKQILIAPQWSFEALLDFDWTYTPSQAFIDMVVGLNKTHHGVLNASAWAKVARYVPDAPLKSIKLSNIEQKQLSKALKFLADAGHEVREQMVFVESLGSQWMAGLAKNGVIYIPRSTFGKGTKFLASTLLEEHIHLSLGYGDMTREMQDWLFDKVVSLIEEENGAPL